MPVSFGAPPAVYYLRFLPEILLTGFAIVLMVLEPLTGARAKRYMGRIALVGLFGALAGAAWAGSQGGDAFFGMIVVDGFASFFRILCIAAGILVVLASIDFMRREAYESGEYYALVLFATVGMMLVPSGADLLSLFISLELMSLSVYVLVGYLRGDRRSNEAAIKYFMLGAFSSGVLLYGMSLVYGVAGSTRLVDLSVALPEALSGDGDATMLVAVGVALLVAGVYPLVNHRLQSAGFVAGGRECPCLAAADGQA